MLAVWLFCSLAGSLLCAAQESKPGSTPAASPAPDSAASSGTTPASGAGDRPIPSEKEKQFLSQARSGYYSLAEHGLQKLQCTAIPDWAKFVTDYLGSHPPEDAAKKEEYDKKIARLNRVHYTVTIDEQMKVTVTPFRTDGGDPEEEFGDLVKPMGQQMIKGFFESWVQWEWQNPLPDAATEFSAKPEGSGHHLIVKPGCSRPEVHSCPATSQIDMVLNQDNLLIEESSASPGLKIKMFPKFAKTDQGLVISAANSDMNNGQIKISFELQMQNVEGFKLPSRTTYTVPTQPEHPLVIEWAITDYKLN